MATFILKDKREMTTALPLSFWQRATSNVLLPLGMNWASIGFAVRTTAASLTALYIALALDFGEAKWAAMTVWIVAQPNRGMSLSKSQYRLAGTLAGASVGVTLIIAFDQMPEMFFLALALWLALCTAISTALRNFRSYGAVLAGYTAAIIGIAGASQPAALFDIAVARVAYISLGIAVEAGFTAIFSPGSPLQTIEQGLANFLQLAITTTARTLRGEDTGAASRSVFANAVALDAAGEYAAASSPVVRRYIGHLRASIASALAQIVAAHAARKCLIELRDAERCLAAKLASAVATIGDRPLDAANQLEKIRNQIHGLRDTRAMPRSNEITAIRPPGITDRLELLHFHAEEALSRMTLGGDRKRLTPRTRFAFHIDFTAAALNAARAFLSLLAAATFWVESAWPSGGSLVVTVAIVTGLFASRPDGIAAGIGFIKGAATAVIVAGICNFVILPGLSGFAALAAVTAPFFILGGIGMRAPTIAAPSASFTLFVWDLIAPDNASRPDFADFANGALTLLIAIACGTLMFALIFPYRPTVVRQRLLGAARRDLKTIGANRYRSTPQEWLSRAADRIGRLAAASVASSPELREREYRGLLANTIMGHAAIALLDLSKFYDPAASRTVGSVVRRLASGSSIKLDAQASRAAARLSRMAADPMRPVAERRQLARGAVHCEDLARASAEYSRFLAPAGGSS